MSYKKIKMRKKGALSDEFSSVIIAVLGLVLVGAVIFGLYRALVNQENANAKKTIDTLEGKINVLKEGETGKFPFQGFKGAENWYFVGWGKGDSGKPDKCFFDSCICICKGYDASSCQASDAYCRKLDGSKVSVSSSFDSVLTDRYDISANINQNVMINCIKFVNGYDKKKIALLEINVVKGNDGLDVSLARQESIKLKPGECGYSP